MGTKALNREYIQLIENDLETTRKEILAVQKDFKTEADRFDADPVEFGIVPKFFTQEIREHFTSITGTMYGILIKVIERYLKDEEYRKLFGFEPLLEQLILSNSGYESLLPILRIDVFYNEETGVFKFCECNTDGTSGMGEEWDIAQAMASTSVFRTFAQDKNIVQDDLFEALIDEFLKIYDGYDKKVADPVIAVVDFMESGVCAEFETFKKRVEARGYKAIVADIRQLTYKNKSLYHNGIKIDAVYRRAVTGEIMAKKETCSDFIQSILEEAVCVIGHPRTQIAHVKLHYIILSLPQTQAFLTDSEIEFIQKHIPFTTMLQNDDYDPDQILSHKDDWVIKPSDMYASKNVCVGKNMTDKEWSEAFERGVQNNYLLQSYYEPYHSENAYFDDEGNLVVDYFRNITGLYVFNGKFSGVFSRISTKAIISSNYQGLSLGSMFVTGS